jgi:hypothetical protein
MQNSIVPAKLTAPAPAALGIGLLLNRSIYRWAAREFLASAALNIPGLLPRKPRAAWPWRLSDAEGYLA